MLPARFWHSNQGWVVQWVIPWIWICTEGVHILVTRGNEDCSLSTRDLVLAWQSDLCDSVVVSSHSTPG